MATTRRHRGVRLGGGLVLIGALVAAALVADAGAPPAGAGEARAGGSLDLTAVSVVDDGLALDLVNVGVAPCQTVAGPWGTVSVPTVAVDGAPLDASIDVAQFDDRLESALSSQLTLLAPGDRLRIVVPLVAVGDRVALTTVSLGAAGVDPSRTFLLPPGQTASIHAQYATPRFEGSPDDLCAGVAEMSAAEVALPAAPSAPRAEADRPPVVAIAALLALLVLLLVVLALLVRSERARRAGPGVDAVLAALGVAATVLTPAVAASAQDAGATGGWAPGSDAGLVAAAAPCLGEFATLGDPLGILGVDRSKITLNPRLEGTSNGYNAVPIGGLGVLYWDPRDAGTYRGGETKTPCSVLFHELHHALQRGEGRLSYEPCVVGGVDTGLQVTEVVAARAENRYRSARRPALGPRETYAGVPLPSGDCEGHDRDGRKRPTDPAGGSGTGGGGSGSGSGTGGSGTGSGSDSGTGSGTGGSGTGSGAGGSKRGGVFGDPHLTTFDGLLVSFQTVGDFVLVRSTDPASGGFEVQVRQAPVPGSRTVSSATSFGLDVAGDEIVVELAGGLPALRIDGGPPSLLDDDVALPTGGRVVADRTATGPAATVSWPDGSTATIAPSGRGGMQLTLDLAADRTGALEGLLGDADGDPSNDLVAGGDVLPTPVDEAQITGELADSWAVEQADLLHYAEGETPATFADPTFPDPDAPEPSEAALAAARAVCGSHGVADGPFLDACITDLLATGEASFGAGASEIAAVIGEVTAATSSDPGASGAPSEPATLRDTGEATIGEGSEVRLTGEIDGETADTFTLRVAGPQVVFVGAEDGCRASTARLDITDPDGLPVATQRACSDPVRVELPAAGAYALTISSPDGGAGAYAVGVRGVGADGDDALELGREVSGEIAEDGEQDVFRLSRGAGEVLFFEGADDEDCRDTDREILVRLRQGTDLAVFRPCGEAGRVVARDDGELEVVVGTSGGAGTGAYRFTLTAVPDDDQFTLADGDRVAPGRPGDGAGELEVPGAQDVYVVEVREGDRVEILPSPSCDDDGLRVDVIDPDGLTEGTAVVCQGVLVDAARSTGTYLLRVLGPGVDALTGTYAFRLAIEG